MTAIFQVRETKKEYLGNGVSDSTFHNLTAGDCLGLLDVFGIPASEFDAYFEPEESAIMSEMGKKGGSSTSEAKKAAVRENGKKGGRPINLDPVHLGKVARKWFNKFKRDSARHGYAYPSTGFAMERDFDEILHIMRDHIRHPFNIPLRDIIIDAIPEFEPIRK